MTTRAALLVVDVQMAMFDETYPVHQGSTLLDQIQTAITRAREVGVPVIYVRHGEGPGEPLARGTEGWHVHPAIAPQAGDLIIDKTTPDSFYGTPLQAELEARGIHRLILTGIQTDLCVDTTCRRAFSLGYKVTLVRDAHSTWNSRHLSAAQIIDHHNDVLRNFAEVRALAEIGF